MSTLSFTSLSNVVRSAENAVDRTEAQRSWRTAALAMLSVRVIQGFIYWGGGSRRFIYAPSKLNPDAPAWMANKFQSAVRHRSFDQLHAASFLAALCRRDPVQRRRTDRWRDADGGSPDARRRPGIDGFFRAADGDVRLAGRDLYRRMDDGGL